MRENPLLPGRSGPQLAEVSVPGAVPPPVPGSPRPPGSDPARWGEAVSGTQAAAGSALILLSASVNDVRQGQRAGRCSVKPRA